MGSTVGHVERPACAAIPGELQGSSEMVFGNADGIASHLTSPGGKEFPDEAVAFFACSLLHFAAVEIAEDKRYVCAIVK